MRHATAWALTFKTASPLGCVGSFRLYVQEAYRMPTQNKSASASASGSQANDDDEPMHVIMPPRIRTGSGTAKRRNVK